MNQRIIGLTGGIGTGKTAISDYITKQYQIPILDADIYAREAVQLNSPILDLIVERYGESIKLPHGSLNRKVLGSIIFNDAAEKEWLESQIHPYVYRRLQDAIKRLDDSVIVLVIPLLFEAKMTDLVTEIWVVTCPEAVQISRIKARDGLKTSEAIARIRSQLPQEQKIANANIVLNNDSNLQALHLQIDLAMSVSKSLRIVSLLPSATEIVNSLGLIDYLVGCSHECDYPPEVKKLPICTKPKINTEQNSAAIDQDIQSLCKSALSIYDLEIEILQQLQPTHIITQDQCDLCAVSFSLVMETVKEIFPTQPEVISLQPNQLKEVWQDISRVADILKTDPQPLLNSINSRLEAIQKYTESLPSNQIPRVVTIEWVDPLMVGGNWIPELVTIAGGDPLLILKGETSSYITWDQLEASQPDVIVIMPCGFDLERNLKESKVLTQSPQWQNLPAVKNNRVFLVDGNAYFNRPGPRLVDSLEILAEIFNPQQFKFGYQHQGWKIFA